MWKNQRAQGEAVRWLLVLLRVKTMFAAGKRRLT